MADAQPPDRPRDLSFKIFLKIGGTVALETAASLRLADYYSRSDETTKKQILEILRSVWQIVTKYGNVVLNLVKVSIGCVCVELECHSAKSFVQFLENFESNKQRLADEFKKIGIEQLTVKFENKEETEKQKEEIRVSHYEKARTYLKASSDKASLTFDLKVKDGQLLEIGYVVASIFQSCKTCPKGFEKCHFIIQEAEQVSSCDRCGECQTVPLEDAISKFREAVKKCTFLVTHSGDGAEDFLRKIGVDISELKKEIIDTQQIEFQFQGDQLHLENLRFLFEKYNKVGDCKARNTEVCGNVYYTMHVFNSQMSAEMDECFQRKNKELDISF